MLIIQWRSNHLFVQSLLSPAGSVAALTGDHNDLTMGCQNLNPLSHPNATLAPQAWVSGENLNYVILTTKARQARASGEILNFLLSH